MYMPPITAFRARLRDGFFLSRASATWRACVLLFRALTNFGYPCWDGIKDTFRIL